MDAKIEPIVMTDDNTKNQIAIALKKTAELNNHIEFLPDLLMAAYNEIVRLEGLLGIEKPAPVIALAGDEGDVA